jgi:hypothetical protein
METESLVQHLWVPSSCIELLADDAGWYFHVFEVETVHTIFAQMIPNCVFLWKLNASFDIILNSKWYYGWMGLMACHAQEVKIPALG